MPMTTRLSACLWHDAQHLHMASDAGLWTCACRDALQSLGEQVERRWVLPWLTSHAVEHLGRAAALVGDHCTKAATRVQRTHHAPTLPRHTHTGAFTDSSP